MNLAPDLTSGEITCALVTLCVGILIGVRALARYLKSVYAEAVQRIDERNQQLSAWENMTE